MVDFVLGRLKFVYKGNWSTSTAYIKDDIVTYGGRSFVCVANHTSSGNVSGGFYTDSANWNLINDGIANRGVWATSTFYKVNDIAKYGGKLYIATTGHTSSATANGGFYAGIANWQLLNDGIENKGDWVSGTYYKVNDVVKWGSSLYLCNTGHTAGTNWVDTEANFTLYVGGLEFEDSWTSATLYQPGDIVRYGGYLFTATNESSNVNPTNTSFWDVLSTGFSVQGEYNNGTGYKPGDVVQFGGYTYAARVNTTGVLPSNTSNWDLVGYGAKWNNDWSNSTIYYKGDTVRFGGSSYISITHNNANNTPDPANTTNWNLLSQGSNNFAQMTNTGDMLFLNIAGVDNLPIGANGYILTSNTSGLPEWRLNSAANNVYYVSVNGVDAPDAGRTLQRPFRTIKYATENVPNNSVIEVKAGTYEEILPITVPNGVSVVGDSQRTVIVQPAAGYSGAGNTMWLLSNATLLKQMTFLGMTGFIPGGTADDITTATVGGVFIRLNPASPITTKSPYVLECSAISTGGVGVIVDGSTHASGFKSMVFHAYTNINDGGVGYWVSNNGRAEIVSCFTYFCYFGFAATAGGFIRGLNNNNSYGNFGAVSRGFDATESVVTARLAGEQLQLTANSVMNYTVGETITGSTSGATGRINNVQTAANKVYYSRTNANTFANSETIVGATSGMNGIITSSGVTGQRGFVVVANNFSSDPTGFMGRSIEFSGDSSAYVVQAVSGTYTNTQSNMVFVLAQEKVTASSNGANVVFRQNYSQIRLTGHDFLDIGTGNTVTTNYPNAPITMPSQANEVVEGRPGRVYYVTTDQNGNFRVGDYFRIDQATGRATLDASAFNLSGLSELRLGSIGAQLGETINEFSADGTLGGNSNFAVPTEQAVKTYVDSGVALVRNVNVSLAAGNYTANYSNTIIDVTNAVDYRAIVLPSANAAVLGPAKFQIRNRSNFTIGVVDNTNDLLTAIQPSGSASISLANNSSVAGEWNISGSLLQPFYIKNAVVIPNNSGTAADNNPSTNPVFSVELTSSRSFFAHRNATGTITVYAVDYSTVPATTGTPLVFASGANFNIISVQRVSDTRALVFTATDVYLFDITGNTVSNITGLTNLYTDPVRNGFQFAQNPVMRLDNELYGVIFGGAANGTPVLTIVKVDGNAIRTAVQTLSPTNAVVNGWDAIATSSTTILHAYGDFPATGVAPWIIRINRYDITKGGSGANPSVNFTQSTQTTATFNAAAYTIYLTADSTAPNKVCLVANDNTTATIRGSIITGAVTGALQAGSLFSVATDNTSMAGSNFGQMPITTALRSVGTDAWAYMYQATNSYLRVVRITASGNVGSVTVSTLHGKNAASGIQQFGPNVFGNTVYYTVHGQATTSYSGVVSFTQSGGTYNFQDFMPPTENILATGFGAVLWTSDGWIVAATGLTSSATAVLLQHNQFAIYKVAPNGRITYHGLYQLPFNLNIGRISNPQLITSGYIRQSYPSIYYDAVQNIPYRIAADIEFIKV